MLADTHCHLDFSAFDDDREEVLTRAKEAGVLRILNPGIDVETSREAIRLAELYEEVYAAAGIHPNEASAWSASTLAELRDFCQHPKVVAVGEIGLDYYRERTPHPLQQEVFRAQLDLAGQSGLPVVVHTRDASPEDRQATRDALQILSEWRVGLLASGSILGERPGVLHSFSGTPELAHLAIQAGFQIGITGPVTFRNGKLVQEVVASLPVENILIETDAPYLTPHPHRGKRNEPAFVGFVAEKIAEIHQLSGDVAARLTFTNAERLFFWQART